MPQLLYYVPGCSHVAQAQLTELGLTHALGETSGGGMAQRGCTGPDGAAGVVLAASGVPGADGTTVGHYPKRQRWVAPGGARKWWVGMNTDQRPGPGDLQRADMTDGHEVTLLDGNPWIVPVAHSEIRGPTLPQRLELDPETGAWKRCCLPAHDALCRDAERVWATLIAGLNSPATDDSSDPPPEGLENDAAASGAVAVTLDDGADIACRALGMNYRVGAVEISLLGLLTDPLAVKVCQALVDWPQLIRVMSAMGDAEKKSADAPTPVT